MQMEGKPKQIPADMFEKTKLKVEALYSTLRPIYCPYIKAEVHFNVKGIEHIKFKEWNKPRVLADQFHRLKLIHLVPRIIRESHTVQGIWHRKEWERQKKHGKWIKTLKEVTYYEFVAVIDGIRIKVILKEVAGNSPFFWSIIPYWRTNEITQARVLHDNDILQDGDFSDEI